MRGRALVLLLAMSGCNALLGIDDLTLVDAPPPDAQSTFVVREGLAGYAKTQDTYLVQADNTVKGDEPAIMWNRVTDSDTTAGLLRFDDLFVATGIPAGATIRMATLELSVTAIGMTGRLYEAAVDWTEATTYDTFGAVAGVQATDRGVQVTTFDASALGTIMLNVTTSVQRWSDAPASNRGWILVSADNLAAPAGVASSDAADEGTRPRLTVEISAN